MPGPFNVEGPGVPGTQVWAVDGSGNTVQSGNVTLTGTITGASIVSGTQSAVTQVGIETFAALAGVNTSAAANYLNSTIGAGGNALLGTAASGTQLSDTTRDYMVYLGVVSGGAAATLSIGAANTAVSTLYAAATCGPGTQYAFRLPAGWYIRFQATASVQQTAISC